MGWVAWALVGGSDPSWVTETLVGGSDLSGWLCHHPSLLSSTTSLCGKEKCCFCFLCSPQRGSNA